MFVYAYVVVVVHRFFGVIVIPLVFVLIQFVIMILHTYTKSFQLVLLNTGHNGLYRWKIHRNTCLVTFLFASMDKIRPVKLNKYNRNESECGLTFACFARWHSLLLHFFLSFPRSWTLNLLVNLCVLLFPFFSLHLFLWFYAKKNQIPSRVQCSALGFEGG